MSTTPTNRQVNIYINQASAERSLESLQKKANKVKVELEATEKAAEDLTENVEKLADTQKDISRLKTEVENLGFEIKEGEKAGKDMTAEVKKLAATEKDIKKLTKSAEDLKKSIVTGKDAAAQLTKQTELLAQTNTKIDTLKKTIAGDLAPSFNQVKARVIELRKEIEDMSKDAPGYAQKFDEFEKVSARFTQMQGEIRNVGKALEDTDKKGSSFLGQVKAIALGTIVGNTVQAALEKIGGYFSSIISGNAKLSDSLADVRKATGLTDAEVKNLNKSLAKIDTRTSVEELRNIAVGLGQIGQAASPEAVAAIDKIVVALGDEFNGGAKEITTTLGILRNNLQDIKTGNYGDDMLHIGNALNVLGAEGLATAPVVVDFANRLSGIAGTFGATAGQILGLSASLQELGIPAERGATAVTRLLQSIASDTDKFGKVAAAAGLNLDQFKKLVNSDIVTALTKVAEGARKAGVDNIAFGKILKDLDADGSGAGEVLSKIASNADLLSSKITLATSALKESNSVTDEFNLKNTNMAAKLEKLEKAISSTLTSKLVSAAVQYLLNQLIVLVNNLKSFSDFISRNATAIGLWTAAMAVHILMSRKLVLAKLEEKIVSVGVSVAMGAEAIATTALGAAKALLTLNIVKLRQEFKLLAVLMSTNPFTLLLAAAGAVVGVFSAISSAINKVSDATRREIDIQGQVAQATSQTISKLEEEVKAATNSALGHDKQAAALKRLIAISPEYLSGLTLQNLTTKEGLVILGKYVQMLKTKAELDALSAGRAKALQDQNDAKFKADKAKTDSGFARDEYSNTVHPNSSLSGSVIDAVRFGSFNAEGDAVAEFYTEKAAEAQKAIDWYDKRLGEATANSVLETVKTTEASGKVTKAAAARTIEDIENAITALDAAWHHLAVNDRAGIKENRDNKKELEKELAELQGKKTPEDRAADRAAKSAEAKAKRAQEALIHWKEQFQQLQKDAEAISESSDQREIQRVKDKYAKLRAEAEKYFRDFGKHIAEATGLNSSESKELDALMKKQFGSRSDKEYKDALEYSGNFFESQRQQAAEAYNIGQLNRDDYSKKLIAIDHDEANKRASIAFDYASTSAKAAKDAEDAKTKAAQDGIKDREAVEKKSAQDKVDHATLAVNTAPKGSTIELKAKEDLLRAQFELENQYIDKTSDAYKAKQAQLNRELKEMDKAYVIQKIDQALQVMNQLSSIAGQYLAILNQKDQQALDSDKAKNDAAKTNLQKRLDAGRITRGAYDKAIEKMDQDYDKKEKEVKLKQFKRNKALSLVQAVINTAQAVTAALTAGPVIGVILAALAAGLGAVQIGLISSQKPPEYGKGRRPQGKGGVPDGPSHAEGGINLVDSKTGKVTGVMQGNEPILSVETYENNRALVDQLLDASMYGGGRSIQQPAYLYRQPRAINSGYVAETLQYNQVFRNGGFARSNNSPAATTSGSAGNAQLPIAQLVSIMEKLHARIENGIDANVYWNDIDKKNQQNTLLRKAGSYNAAS